MSGCVIFLACALVFAAFVSAAAPRRSKKKGAARRCNLKHLCVKPSHYLQAPDGGGLGAGQPWLWLASGQQLGREGGNARGPPIPGDGGKSTAHETWRRVGSGERGEALLAPRTEDSEAPVALCVRSCRSVGMGRETGEKLEQSRAWKWGAGLRHPGIRILEGFPILSLSCCAPWPLAVPPRPPKGSCLVLALGC